MGARFDKVKRAAGRLAFWRKRLAEAPVSAIGGVNRFHLAEAIATQATWEDAHPVAYAEDQRLLAVIQRLRAVAARERSALPEDAEVTAIVRKALEGAEFE